MRQNYTTTGQQVPNPPLPILLVNIRSISWGCSPFLDNEFTRFTSVCSLFTENSGPTEAEHRARSQLDRYVLFSIQSLSLFVKSRHYEETRALHRASTASMHAWLLHIVAALYSRAKGEHACTEINRPRYLHPPRSLPVSLC